MQILQYLLKETEHLWDILECDEVYSPNQCHFVLAPLIMSLLVQDSLNCTYQIHIFNQHVFFFFVQETRTLQRSNLS